MGKKVLLIDSSLPINVRNKKIINSLGVKGYVIKVCSWDRTGMNKTDGADFIYNNLAPLGSPFSKLIRLYGFYKFIKKKTNFVSYDIIIASHWEILLLGSFLKKKHQKLVYENLDIPTAGNPLIVGVLKKIEKYALRNTDVISFASRFFVPLYGYSSAEKVLLENLPDVKTERMPLSKRRNSENRIVIAFVGTIRYKEILYNLIDAVRKFDFIDLYFYGDGPDKSAIETYSLGLKNVLYFGSFDYSEIEKIYNQFDFVWAVYPNKDYNVKYAISNKYYESILYTTPGIFADKTELGNFVEMNNIGFTVNPYDVISIQNLLLKLSESGSLKEQMFQRLVGFRDKNFISWSVAFNKLAESL